MSTPTSRGRHAFRAHVPRRRRGRAAQLFILLGLFWGTGVAIAAGGGARIGAFANLEPGGRGTALAGALGPIADDPSALHWNPAGLLDVAATGIEVTYADLFGLGLARHTCVFAAFPRMRRQARWEDGSVDTAPGRPKTSWGLGLQTTSVDLDPETYGEYDLALALAKRGTWDLAFAFVGHYLMVRSDLDATEASGYAFDLALARDVTRQVQASLVLRSLLSSLRWKDSDAEKLVRRVHLGVGWQPHPSLRVPAEILFELDGPRVEQLAAGAEWLPLGEVLALRGGLRWRDDGYESVLLPAAGAGLKWKHIAFDYGLALGRYELDATHRLGLRVRF